MAHAPNMKRGEPGFTLIEMMVVMTIIAVLAGLAGYTYFTQVARMKLNGDVRKLDQTLQQAKMFAVSTGVPAGVVFLRRDGEAIGNQPDQMFIFKDSAPAPIAGHTLGDKHFTNPDGYPPCHGCLVNKIYDPSITKTGDPRVKRYIPVRCNPIDTFPDCTTTPNNSMSLQTDDVLVDGPITLETGDYFTLILGSKNPKVDPRFSTPQYEYILFDPMGQVVYPTTESTTDKSIYLQNHPNQKDITLADRGAVQVNWISGVNRVIRVGPVPKDDWKK